VKISKFHIPKFITDSQKWIPRLYTRLHPLWSLILWYTEVTRHIVSQSFTQITFNTSRYAHTARIYYTLRYCCRKRNVNFPECRYRQVLRGISGISISASCIELSCNPHDCVAKRRNACVIQWSPKQLSSGTDGSKLSSCSVVRVITLSLDISYIPEKGFARFGDINYSGSFKGYIFCQLVNAQLVFTCSFRVFFLAIFYKNNFPYFLRKKIFLLNILFRLNFYIHIYVQKDLSKILHYIN